MPLLTTHAYMNPTSLRLTLRQVSYNTLQQAAPPSRHGPDLAHQPSNTYKAYDILHKPDRRGVHSVYGMINLCQNGSNLVVYVVPFSHTHTHTT